MSEPRKPDARFPIESIQNLTDRAVRHTEQDVTIQTGQRAPSNPISVDHSNLDRRPESAVTVSHIQLSLHEAEAIRASNIGLIFSVICLVTLAWLPFLDSGHSGHSLIFASTLFVFALTGLGVWRVAKNPKKYDRNVFRIFGIVGVVACVNALIYLGPYSPTALAITLGISFFGQGADRRGAVLICSAAIILTLALFIGVLTGRIQDIGVFTGNNAGASAMLFMTLMVPMVLLVTFAQATWSRDAVENAMGSVASAVMDINLKKVQLEEAQAELERIFGDEGLSGRLTGQSISDYRLGPLLGRGASGEVYDAVEQKSGKRSALKILNTSDTQNEAIVSRFKREAQIARQIRSPHVTQVYEFGQDTDGTLYIAMERLDGHDLAAILRRRGRLSVRACHRLVHHICRGLTAAHEQGVIHRDIKPHNLFAHRESSTRNVWKVLDFGVSKWTTGAETLTHAGCVVGTPRYMAPEQARGHELDHRTDLYALGAVLYRCLTGAPPFQGSGFNAVAAAAYQRPTRPQVVAPDLDGQISDFLSIAMAPDPVDRFSTAGQLADAFDQAYRSALPSDIVSAARRIEWADN